MLGRPRTSLEHTNEKMASRWLQCRAFYQVEFYQNNKKIDALALVFLFESVRTHYVMKSIQNNTLILPAAILHGERIINLTQATLYSSGVRTACVPVSPTYIT